MRAKKSHRAVNVITLIAVVGVTIATMAMVLVLSIYNGFSDLAESQLSTFEPDLSVVPAEGKVLANADSLATVVSGVDGVASSMPTLTEKALLVDNDMRIPIVLKGVPSGYNETSGLDKAMVAGEYAESTTDGYPAMQLSVGVANRISRYPSAQTLLQIYVPRRKGRVNPANPAASFRSEELAFSGVFAVSNTDIDASYVIAPLDAARNLLDYDSEATAIDIAVSPDRSVSKVKAEIQKLVGPGYKVLTRLEARAESFRMISIEKWVTFMMLVCILVIALFNVISTLSLLAVEKRENMATLRALGAKPSMVRNIFVSEGFLVTTLGGALGIALGVAIALLQQIFHIVKLGADASTLTISYYPVRVEFVDILAVAGVIVVLSCVVGLIAGLIVKSMRRA